MAARNPTKKRFRLTWWDWVVLAAVVELYFPRKNRSTIRWWDWFILGAAFLSPFF